MNPSSSPRPPHVLTLAWRQLLRDARAGELRLLMLAVALAVAAVCAVTFLADRLDLGLRRDAAKLLGGDAVIASDQPTPAALTQLATAAQLAQARTATFPSMARAPLAAGGAVRLVAVKAVSGAYPLRGQLMLEGGQAAGAPKPGEVYADQAVLDTLNLRVGEALLLGDSSLKIAGAIANEPDRGAGFMSFAPRVLMAEADLAATGLVQPASRITYRLALGAAPKQSAALREFIKRTEGLVKDQQFRGVRIESLESGRPEMRQTLDRASRFLKLVAMLAALLAAVAVALAARDFSGRHLDDCAMLRVLGQTQRRIAWAYGLEFGAAGLAASLLGVVVGFALHYGFVALLGSLIDASLPLPSLWPALLGLGLGLSLLAGFGLPPILQLAAVPPLRVIRRDLGGPSAGSLLVLVGGALGFAGILTAMAEDARMGLIAAAGFGLALGFFALLAYAAVRLLRGTVSQAAGPRWLLLATRQMASRPAFAVVQVAAL
ncbi:MAG TPA: FtsX-like permease family protein, partial [Burkholderiaceae bacterium]